NPPVDRGRGQRAPCLVGWADRSDAVGAVDSFAALSAFFTDSRKTSSFLVQVMTLFHH
ncbi:MAG: hypothetical protein QOJ42_4276, partial [Acidobacteriaceae bacterium]|nr:hypothetical protein [Acidobacteriaceae bacterium]